jgi:hypothetical protein
MISEQLLQNLYDAFNRREIDRIIELMDVNVKWANGMEGGFIYGSERVREYWQKQFETIDPQLEPLKFETDERDRRIVTIKQIVRDFPLNLLLKQIVRQIF